MNTEKEQQLRRQIDNIPSTYPGYDEYEYFLDEIGHNPYELAAYLTVKYEDYKKASVREILNTLFSQQYKLTTRQRMETRTRTVTKTGTRTVRHSDGSTTEEEYSYEVEESYTVRIGKPWRNTLNTMILRTLQLPINIAQEHSFCGMF